jgi:broad specificity phosphatase PhoE
MDIINNNLFFKKYVKYKIKYNNLKQIGGTNVETVSNIIDTNNTIVSIIVTHNGRLRCLLDYIKPGLGKNKFKNCAILELKLSNNNTKLSLVYEGELDGESTDNTKIKKEGELYGESTDNTKIKKENDSDKTSEIENCYFIKENSEPKNGETRFENFNLSGNIFNLSDNININKTYIFYLIRHGDGTHNKAKRDGNKMEKVVFGELVDADLTPNGINQAQNAGKELKKLVKQFQDTNNNYLLPIHYFVSDLKRTRHTLYKIYNTINENLNNNINKTFTVLPCSHELDYKSNSHDGQQNQNSQEKRPYSCDGQQKINSQENSIHNPFPNNADNKKINIHYDISNNEQNVTDTSGNITINWEYYYNFYGNNYRHSGNNYRLFGYNKKKTSCRTTNMIVEALRIINGNEKQPDATL